MKSMMCSVLIVLLLFAGLTGCAGSQQPAASQSATSTAEESLALESQSGAGLPEASRQALTKEEILEAVSPYLENAEYQDPAAYPPQEDFLLANLGLSEADVSDVVLYLGAPNQNTTFFLMLSVAPGGSRETVLEKIEARMQAHVHTAEMGYMEGYREYSVIETDPWIFAVMQEDPQKYEELIAFLSSLP